MTEEQKTLALSKLKEARETWVDLPDHVHTDAYEAAMMSYIELCIMYGHYEIETLVIYILHHETGGREPYFRVNY